VYAGSIEEEDEEEEEVLLFVFAVAEDEDEDDDEDADKISSQGKLIISFIIAAIRFIIALSGFAHTGSHTIALAISIAFVVTNNILRKPGCEAN
jgi:hypothetical protein